MKIALKLPDSTNKVMQTFPFIHAVKELLEPEDLHIVGTKDAFPLLTLLPFKAYFHEFDLEDYKNFIDIHRFAVNKKDLSHADIFFSLTEEPKDHFMTMSFRGKERVGFEGKWSSLFLNKKRAYPSELHEAAKSYSLLEFYSEVGIEDRAKITSKKFKPPIADWSEMPYIMIDLPYDPINNEVPPDWTEFIDLFEKQRIFLSVSSAEEEQRKIVLQRFINTLKLPVEIHPFYFHNISEFAQMAAYSSGVIANNGVLTEVSTYAGASTIILYEKGDPRTSAPLYFQGTNNIHSTSDMTLLKKPGNVQSKDIVTKFDLGILFDKALSFFSL